MSDLFADARALVARHLVHTPLVPSEALGERLGVPVFYKLENLQITGSFKVRGALVRLALLTQGERARGVVTASAGNHGLGVAWAARLLGLRATVYLPSTVDEAKHRGMVALGATVIRTPHPGYDDTEILARREAENVGAVFVSAFDDPAIMAGNGGTLAAEIAQDLPGARTIILPVGGGGLAAGVAQAWPGTIIAAQLEACPALALSLERGRAVTRMPAVETLAGGVEGGLGEGPFAVLNGRVRRVALVSEAAVHDAFRWMVGEERILVDPTAAVPVAACLTGAVGPVEGPGVVVLTGRNVALGTVRRLLA